LSKENIFPLRCGKYFCGWKITLLFFFNFPPEGEKTEVFPAEGLYGIREFFFFYYLGVTVLKINCLSRLK
jgi:hypothetical protein